jgi:16S rRNA (cytosine1402-N4)-methyltransferase
MTNDTFYHQPVLLHECIEALEIKPEGSYIDATFGGGGHSKEILKRLGPKGTLMVFDQDEDAQKNCPNDSRIRFVRENFRYAARFVRMYNMPLHGVLADLGVSSYQFDTAERGFSTRFEANLDMRMDQRIRTTATHVLNTYPEKKLEQLFEHYGEVTNARQVASRITEARSRSAIQTVQELKQCLNGVMYGNPNKYFAQIFQALRIEVNDELNALKEFLETITPALSTKGRLAVITFHSLEDRIVKQWMKQGRFEEELHPFVSNEKSTQLKIITKKPIIPGATEQHQNPRSRSAKLRVAERM